MFIHSTRVPVLAQVVRYSEQGDAHRRISYEREGKTVLPLHSFVLQCNFCASKCACTVVVRFPRGGWGTVIWQLSPRGCRGTVFLGLGKGKGKGKGKVLGRTPNSSVTVIPTCPSQHPFRLAGSQTS